MPASLNSQRLRSGLVALSVILLTAAGVCDAPQSQSQPTASQAAPANAPYRDRGRPVAERVADLMGRMTLDDKLGQMTQAERKSATTDDITQYRLGSILSGGGSTPRPNNAEGWTEMVDAFQRAALATPLGIPMLYGVDAVHGHNNVSGATVFPHNIGLGATRDPALVQQIGRATAEEVAGTGAHWTFAPCLCVARDDRWGRTYESFGERPEIAGSMTTVITGLQGEQLGGPASILATAKHYLGDGGTSGGKDQGDTKVSDAELRSIHLPPYQAAIKRGVGSVMVSYSSFNGDKVHGSKYLITDVLKGELGFTGFVVSDWNGMDQIDGSERLSAEDVRAAVNAGIDMAMVPDDWANFIELLREEVRAGRVTQERIDDANRRILTKKFELGLFEKPLTDRSFAATVGNAAHRTLARTAVAKSQVLLKNSAQGAPGNAGGVLPLAKANNKIFVAGKSADNIGNQSGGWTITWQGESGETTRGTTILQGIRETIAPSSSITYDASGDGIGKGYKVAVAVIGEKPYAEFEGDRPGGVVLDPDDLAMLAKLRASGVPIVVVLVSGRPMDVGAQLAGWTALLASWLPGTEGGGVADVLFGTVKPGGKLPVTWPRDGKQPANGGDALFPFGFGLTY